jgi:hypothetical protein
MIPDTVSSGPASDNSIDIAKVRFTVLVRIDVVNAHFRVSYFPPFLA